MDSSNKNICMSSTDGSNKNICMSSTDGSDKGKEYGYKVVKVM